MASNQNFVTYICDQLSAAGMISSRRMFGGHAIYCGEKVVALICENQLFVKPTPSGKAAIRNCVEKPPYPGAKPHFLIRDRLDDREWLSCLIAITERELPEPRMKRTKMGRRKR